MTEVADLCNEALSEIGAGSIADLSEASTEARACAIAYTPLRQALLRSAPWSFARKTLALTQLGAWSDTSSPSEYPWGFKYAYPADCVKLRYVLWGPALNENSQIASQVGDLAYSPSLSPCRSNRFLPSVSTDADNNQIKVVLSNVSQALGVYTADITNPDLFDPLFHAALVAALASKLVIPLTGNAGMKGNFVQLANDAVMTARAVDGNEAVPTTEHIPDWLVARGIPAVPYTGFDLGFWYSGWDNSGWGE